MHVHNQNYVLTSKYRQKWILKISSMRIGLHFIRFWSQTIRKFDVTITNESEINNFVVEHLRLIIYSSSTFSKERKREYLSPGYKDISTNFLLIIC